jgi:hypothetical protein
MCLLIQKPKDVEFKEEHLVDFYNRNRDGIGVMYSENGALHTSKMLPNTAQDTLDFYEHYIKGRECAIHYRMRTHGDIDLINCHPYPVFGFDDAEHPMPMALMHNGVLRTGNAKDSTKSDTWHYIRDYLHVLLKDDPSLAFDPVFADVIGGHIGNNRFVLMNHLGQTTIINKYQGVMFNGAWLSNEYAWSSTKFLPRKQASTYGSWHGGKGDTYYSAGKEGTTPKKSSPAPSPTASTGKGGKTKKSGKKPGEQLTLPSIKSGGKTTLTEQVKNERNGVSVDCKWLDDVLELRSILDAIYVDNAIRNRQLETLIEESDPERAYFLLELLADGIVSKAEFNTVMSSRTEMRMFADIPREEFYPDAAPGRRKSPLLNA